MITANSKPTSVVGNVLKNLSRFQGPQDDTEESLQMVRGTVRLGSGCFASWI